MSIPKRGSGVPPRGSSSGGGKITVNDHTGESISTGVKTIQWNTLDKYGFTATVDPDDPTKVLIGDAPVFADKIVFSPPPLTQVRVSESDPNEPDSFSDGGWANSVQLATANSMPWFNSTIGRGFGEDARLRVVVQWDNNQVDDQTFVCSTNGGTTVNGITVVIANLEPDGDGSADKARINVNIDLTSYQPYPQSGKFTVGFQFLEHKWAETVTFSQSFFYDRTPTSPVITGNPSVREHDTPSERITKFLSGIQYYTLGSKFTIEVPDMDNMNDDTSHPSAGLIVDPSDLGITSYTSSPWNAPLVWNNVGNLDTSQDFNYVEDKIIDINNYRHIGNAIVDTSVQDSFQVSSVSPTNTYKVAIDTVSNPSTDLVEYFDEENKRLQSDYSTVWDSERYLIDGECAVYGGSLYHPADLPRILQNTVGVVGTAGSLSTTLPNERVDGTSRQNPNYTGFNRRSVFFRNFLTGNSTSYSSVNMNVLTNGDLASQLSSGDLKIYIWKLDSVDQASPNIILPPSYNPTSPNSSLTNSIWGHSSYNFAAYDDGVAQTAATSGCLVTQTGNLLNLTMGGYNLLNGILVRFDLAKGVRLDEVSVSFV